MLPEGWVKLTLSEACEMKAGKFVKAEDIAREPTEASYPCYGGNGLRGYTPSYTHDGCYPLIGRQGELCGNVMFAAGKFHATEHAVVVKAKDYIDTTWLYFKLVDLKLNRYATGQAQPGLSVKNLENISFIAPRCALEQKKIAQILSTWDNAISATERLLENSQQRKKALMQQLLTGKKRLPGFEGLSTFQEIFRGKIPSDWSYVHIKEVCSQFNKKNNEGLDLPILSCSKHLGFVDSLSYFKKQIFSDDTSSYKVIPRGCFGFPANHIEEGSIGLQNLYESGLVSPIYVIFKPNKDKVDISYLYLLLKTDHYRQIFASSTNASVDRRGSLRWKEFGQIGIPLPSLEEQQAIANVLTTADQEIDALQKRLDHLKQEKKALMQQLLTGKRRVQVDDAA